MCCSPADGGEISYGKERRGAGFEDGSPGEGGQAVGERGEHFDHGDLDHGVVHHEVGDLEDDGSLEREGRQLEREVLNITILTDIARL